MALFEEKVPKREYDRLKLVYENAKKELEEKKKYTRDIREMKISSDKNAEEWRELHRKTEERMERALVDLENANEEITDYKLRAEDDLKELKTLEASRDFYIEKLNKKEHEHKMALLENRELQDYTAKLSSEIKEKEESYKAIIQRNEDYIEELQNQIKNMEKEKPEDIYIDGEKVGKSIAKKSKTKNNLKPKRVRKTRHYKPRVYFKRALEELDETVPTQMNSKGIYYADRNDNLIAFQSKDGYLLVSNNLMKQLYYGQGQENRRLSAGLLETAYKNNIIEEADSEHEKFRYRIVYNDKTWDMIRLTNRFVYDTRREMEIEHERRKLYQRDLFNGQISF